MLTKNDSKRWNGQGLLAQGGFDVEENWKVQIGKESFANKF